MLSLDTLNEPKMTAALKRLDGDAWEKLFNQITPRLLPFVKSKLVSFAHSLSIQNEAEDIVNATFVKAIAKIGSFDPKKAMITTWIFTIASNLVYDTQRNIKKRNLLLQNYAHNTNIKNTTVNPITADQLLLNIGVDSSQLTETEKMYLKAIYIEELSDEIIALNCGVKTNTVVKARQRILIKLRQLLEQNVGTM